MEPKVEEYIQKKDQWNKELSLLRKTLLELPIEETIKWGAPTYTYNGEKYSWNGWF